MILAVEKMEVGSLLPQNQIDQEYLSKANGQAAKPIIKLNIDPENAIKSSV